MSDEKAADGQLAEKENKVVISPEDCNAALDFWRHFEIPIGSNLQLAFDAFAKDPSFENQEKVKLEVCRAIAETDHEAFKDEMFQRIAEECSGVTFDMQFDKDFEATVAEKK
jgi:hypothetical protein